MNDLSMVCEDTASDETGNETCSTVIQFFKLPETEHFRVVCICQRHAERRGYHSVPRICADTDVVQAHLAGHPICADEANSGKLDCDYNHKTRTFERAKNPSVFFLPVSDTWVTLCATHADLRGYYAFPRQLTEADGKQKYDLQRRFDEAKRTFVQIYHPELTCRVDISDCKREEVAEYIFSDGSSLPLCTVHHADSGARMSREYYDQVYSLRFK